MLSYLKVENFAVVEKSEIDFSKNLNIFTGETGTGKSLLIDAISIFLKKRIPENLIRDVENKLIVEAMFIEKSDEFVLRREVNKGKSLSYINGKLVPFVKLEEKIVHLINIYGQNEHVFLLNTSNHRVFLDTFSKNNELLIKIEEVSKQLKRLLKDLNGLKEKNKQVNEKTDFINFQISEIENLNMEKGDDKKLEHKLKIFSSAEEILLKSDQIIDRFYQNESSIYNAIAENLNNIEYLNEIYPELLPFKNEINKLYGLIPELSSTLSDVKGHVEYNENELNEIEEKLMRLNRLKTKYRLSLEELIEKLENLKVERDQLLNMEFSIKDKEKEIDKLLLKYIELNLELRKIRQKNACKLSSIVERELCQLAMEKAKFIVKFDEVEPDVSNFSENGTDKIEFYFTSNPGIKPANIKDVISGGELSRLMLVLKSIIDDEQSSTYIFDEIDTGIGGKTAEFVGRKLRKISQMNQVICISHLPQIASYADKHFLITKEFKQDKTYSFTKELNDEGKIEEIARLMAGSAVNENVLKAAQNLLRSRSK
jgi:DNA repair protein RecN (Recombination protein N)